MHAFQEQASIDPPPQGVRWIVLPEAADRMRQSERTLRRKCEQTWRAAGVAKMQSPEGGGKPCWHVREDADPRLARGASPEHLPFDLGALSAGQREELLARERAVLGWDRARGEGHVKGRTDADIDRDYLNALEAGGLKVSLNTLRNWRAGFRLNGRAGLVDGRWNRGEVDRSEDPFINEVKRRWLNLRRPALLKCVRDTLALAKANGWEPRSYAVCRAAMQRIPRPVVILRRHGEEAYRNKAGPYIQRHYGTLKSNELWVGDHHQFDVWVNDGGKLVRPWLTAWLDMASRKLVGWEVFPHDPNQDTILLALRVGIESHGVCESVYIDNGKDFDSYSLNGQTKRSRKRRQLIDEDRARGLFKELGVQVRFAEPYNARAKIVERFFGTLEEDFGKDWPTYCGNSPENRPENIDAQLERGNAPTLADFKAAFAAWLERYHARSHTGDGMEGQTPGQAWAAKLDVKRVADPRLLDVVLLHRSQAVGIGRNGVRFQGLYYGQYLPELLERQGEKVYVRVDVRDVSTVQVWSLDDKFICHAPCNVPLPPNAAAQDVRDARKEQNRTRKLVKQYHQAGLRITESLSETMLRQRAEQQQPDAAPDPGGTPAALKPVRHPLERQLEAVEKARRPVRKAAGAEGFDPLDIVNMFPKPASRPARIEPEFDYIRQFMDSDGGAE